MQLRSEDPPCDTINPVCPRSVLGMEREKPLGADVHAPTLVRANAQACAVSVETGSSRRSSVSSLPNMSAQKMERGGVQTPSAAHPNGLDPRCSVTDARVGLRRSNARLSQEAGPHPPSQLEVSPDARYWKNQAQTGALASLDAAGTDSGKSVTGNPAPFMTGRIGECLNP